MDMPEGWKRLNEFGALLVHEREQVASLMKEMAEALEQACGLIESEWGPLSEDELSGKIDRGGSKPFTALKKFKEWK